MFDPKKIKELVLTSLVSDSYSLGAHWVYDEKQLLNSSINWDKLNKPLAIWHKGKEAGDLTHYGDQTYWLYVFLEDKDSFDSLAFMNFWFDKIQIYDGYIDGASKASMENISSNIFPSGSSSTDLSIVGRIAPLLKVSKTKEEFLQNVENFVKITHNSTKALNASNFFAKLLYMVLEGKSVEDSIIELKESSNSEIQSFILNSFDSRNEDTFKTIRKFGPACDIDEGFAGVLHLLLKYDNLKQMLVENAKAGGDSSARGMIASIIFMANHNISAIPKNWLSIKVTIT